MNPLHFDFPKEVGLFRKIIHDNAEFERYWSSLQNSQCAYMSVYGFRAVKPNGRRAEYNTAIVKHFVLDFDKKYRKGSDMVEVEGDEVVEQVRRLQRYLLDENINHGVWFSGNGFHIWISLDKTHLPSSGTQVSHIKAAGKKVINQWKKDMELYCMDPTVPFDTARMIRVPNSYNAKQHVLRWSIPLTSEELLTLSWEDICVLAQEPRNTAYFYGEKGVHLPVKQVRESQFKVSGEPVNFETVKMGSIKILPCLMEAACQVGSNPPHISRASLAIYLASRLRNFLPVQRTTVQMREAHILTLHDFIKTLQWADYDPSTTEYQLRSIVDGGYMERCESLIGKGLCIGRCQLWDGTGEHEHQDSTETIQLSPQEVSEAYSKAKREVEKYKGRVGDYSHNKVSSTFIGLKAEAAVGFYLSRHFDVQKGKGDLQVNSIPIEVKTVTEKDWNNEKGRMIPPAQLEKYVANKAIVVWATVDSHNHMDYNVNLKGWNNAYEVKSKGVPIKTKCDNIWLKNEKDMKEIATIYSALKVKVIG